MANKELLDILLATERALITGHSDPDGDCLGAILALQHLFSFLGKKAVCTAEGFFPKKFEFLGVEEVVQKDITKTEIENFKPTHVFICDASNPDRIGKLKDILSGQVTINIDHHPDNNFFGTYNFVDPKASSACEIIYDKLVEDCYLPLAALQAIMVGIIYDTSGLRNMNTTENCISVLAEGERRGISVALIQRKIFGLMDHDNFMLMAKTLGETQLAGNGKIAWSLIQPQDGGNCQDIAQRVIDELKNILGVEVALTFRSTEEGTKVSLRSNSSFSVNKFAANWGGGGHERAAGIRLDLALEEAAKVIIPRLVEEFNGRNNQPSKTTGIDIQQSHKSF